MVAPRAETRAARNRTSAVEVCCPVCGGCDTRTVAELPNAAYLECACGVTYPDPFPDEREIRSVYERGYMDLELPGHGLHLRFKPEYADAFRAERDLTLRDLGIEPASLAGKRILDVGCANGIFLDYLRGHGVDAIGLDISAEMVEAARRRGLDARVTPLFEIAGRWNLVTLWDVLEHLPEPSTALTHIAELLAPEGDLLVQTPCTGLISAAFGSAWRNFIYPQHLHLFSREGLHHLLRSHGFQVIRDVRFGSGNTSGTIPAPAKLAADRVAKASGHGDTIALHARLS